MYLTFPNANVSKETCFKGIKITALKSPCDAGKKKRSLKCDTDFGR